MTTLRIAVFAFALTLAGLPGLDAQTPGEKTPSAAGSCGVCHGKEAQAFAGSVHAGHEVSCVACHGGDSTLTTKAACVDHPAFKGIPSRKAQVEYCGSCHSNVDGMHQYDLPTDQLALYKSSYHGKALFERDDKNVPTCGTCHGIHDVVGVNDPRSPAFPSRVPKTCAQCHADEAMMKQYKLPADVYAKYASSVHGKGLIEHQQLRLPHCGSCHSSHGARPAGVKEVANVCGHCHVATRDEFMKSPHARAARAGKMQECITCHNHHDIARVANPVTEGWDSDGCLKCHEGNADGGAALASIRTMDQILNGLRTSVASAAEDVKRARGFGIVTAEEEIELNEARHVLIQAGPISHRSSAEDLRRLAEKGTGVVERVRESVEVKLRRVRDRRIAAVVIFAGLAVLLVALKFKLKAFQRTSVDAAASKGKS